MKKTKTDHAAQNQKRREFLDALIGERGAEIAVTILTNGAVTAWVTIPPPTEPLGPMRAKGGRPKELDIGSD